MPRKLIRILLPLLILAIAVIGFLALKATKPQLPAAKPTERAWRINTLAVNPGDHQPILTLFGKVDAPDKFTVVSPKASRVARLPVQDGDHVAKGKLLIALDPADFDPATKQAEANVADIKAQISSEKVRYQADQEALKQERQILDNARKTLNRNQNLANRKLASPAQVETAIDTLERARLSVTSRQEAINNHPSRLASLQAKLESAQAQLASARRDQQRATVAAPFDGIVTDVKVAKGDQVGNNATLLSFYPTNDLQLRALIPSRYAEELIHALQQGHSPTASIQLNGDSVSLKLLRIAGSASGEGVTGIFQFARPETALRLGRVFSINLQRPRAADTVAVPYSALYGNDRIYIVRNGRLHGLDVQLVGDISHRGKQRWLLVRNPAFKKGSEVAITHLPNAIDGLKVDIVKHESAP